MKLTITITVDTGEVEPKINIETSSVEAGEVKPEIDTDKSLYCLKLPTFVENILNRSGIETVEQLLKTPKYELLHINGFGRTALKETEKALDSVYDG